MQEVEDQPGVLQPVINLQVAVNRRWQAIKDKTVPHKTARWGFAFFLLCCYVFKLYMFPGYHIVSYGLGIYILNLLLDWMQPLVDPEDEEGPSLPTGNEDTFKPHIPKLGEFKFWYLASRAIVMGIIATFFDILNVPVFWPILLFYFILLTVVQLKNRIQHMRKYNYNPFSWGKPKFVSG
eukprot:TRINITY_DN11344_c0_g1_i1.p1 TRINITY_DN11344_c0_g1~~TRINITY_DN11344_c0_g1_i1.p1  ORF type:complete len:187 (-),score=32.78 TRINITY_DN11344_c0_g1_i1:47-586(-)